MGGTMRGVLVASLLLAACGGKPSVSTNQSNVCDQLAAVACYDLYQCCAESQIERFLGVQDPRTEDQCKDDLRRACEQRVGIVNASIAAGRAKFDSGVMDGCLKALIAPDNTCSTVDMMLPWTMACMSSAWVGTVAVGGMCLQPFECAG